jgi:hypothetical protein
MPALSNVFVLRTSCSRKLAKNHDLGTVLEMIKLLGTLLVGTVSVVWGGAGAGMPVGRCGRSSSV